jgi:hypothetical protein
MFAIFDWLSRAKIMLRTKRSFAFSSSASVTPLLTMRAISTSIAASTLSSPSAPCGAP